MPQLDNIFSLNAFFSTKDFDFQSLTKPYFMPVQQHTDTVYLLDKIPDLEVIADAVITAKKGIYIGVKTADCVPILLYDPIKSVVGAVHAGWRGTAQGILKKTVSSMVSFFNCMPDNIMVALGPAIKGCCYEVNSDVINALKAQTEGDSFIIQKGNKVFADLHLANLAQAVLVGLRAQNIQMFEYCTRCRNDIFYSYRHLKVHTGRQYSMISL